MGDSSMKKLFIVLLALLVLPTALADECTAGLNVKETSTVVVDGNNGLVHCGSSGIPTTWIMDNKGDRHLSSWTCTDTVDTFSAVPTTRVALTGTIDGSFYCRSGYVINGVEYSDGGDDHSTALSCRKSELPLGDTRYLLPATGCGSDYCTVDVSQGSSDGWVPVGVSYHVDPDRKYINGIYVSKLNPDGPSNGIHVCVDRLTLGKRSVPKKPYLGDTLRLAYTITASAPLSGMESGSVSVWLGEGVSLVTSSLDPFCRLNGRTIICPAKGISNGQSTSVSFEVTIDSVDARSLDIAATLSSLATNGLTLQDSFPLSSVRTVLTQCSDAVDNDRDGLADSNDPGCHTDGNPFNAASYDALDNDETNPPITCFSNSDCGTDGFIGSPMCSESVQTQDYATYTCSNAGTTSSSCSQSISTRTLQECRFGCDGNACTDPDDITCFKDADCDDRDTYTKDACRNPATITAACVYDDIPCLSDRDCTDDNVLTIDTCRRPGSPLSMCSHAPIACVVDTDCRDGDAYTDDRCVDGGTLSAMCIHAPIACLTEADCGKDGFVGQPICNGESVVQTYIDVSCIGPGTARSFCAYDASVETVQECRFGCRGSQCIDPTDIACFTDTDCRDVNVYTEDRCRNRGTPEAVCTHTPIACLTSTDCGTNGLVGSPVCSGDDLVQGFQSFNCLDAGTIDASCTSSVERRTVAVCTFGCSDDMCKEEPSITCFTDLDCDDSDAYTADACLLPGTVDSSCSYAPIACLSDDDCDDEDAMTTDTCVNPGTTQSFCSHGAIECLTDADCPAPRYLSRPYCVEEDVYRTVLSYSCVSQTCVSSTSDVLLQSCAFECRSGECSEQQVTEGSDITISGIRFGQSSDPLHVARNDDVYLTVTVRNDGDRKVFGLEPTITIPDLGLRVSLGKEDLNTGEEETFRGSLRMTLPPGYYPVRVHLSDDEKNVNRVVWREMVVE